MSFSLSLKSLYWLPLSLAVLVVSLASVAGFGGRLWWRFDQLSHFRVQYLVSLTLACLLFLIGRRYTAAWLTAAFALLNLILILPLYIGNSVVLRAPYGAAAPVSQVENVVIREQASVSESPTFRLLLCNVLQTNRQFSLLGQEIQQSHPDLVVVIEVDGAWIDGLQPYLLDFPYAAQHLRRDSFGIAVFSRYQISSDEVMFFGEAHLPSVQVGLKSKRQAADSDCHSSTPSTKLDQYQPPEPADDGDCPLCNRHTGSAHRGWRSEYDLLVAILPRLAASERTARQPVGLWRPTHLADNQSAAPDPPRPCIGFF